MEERQTLLEYENMKKFLELLEENGMKEQKQEVELLAGYVDKMEFQFNNVLDELKNVRQELSAIQDKTIRATATRVVDKVVHKVEDAKAHLVKLKNHIKQTVDKAVTNFKEHGKSALVSAMRTLNVKGLLQTIKDGLDQTVKVSDHGIDKLTKLGDEIHAVNSHMKNVGRVVIGKDTQDTNPRQADKGLLAKVQESLFFTMDVYSKMSLQTGQMLNKIKTIEEKHNEKKSVRSDLKDIRKQQNGKVPSEKVRKEKELG